jgi:signal transduction histidine kinase
MVASVVSEAPPDIDAVMDILDEASRARAHSRELEEKSRELELATAELRAANERLLELDRLKDDFISTVSHELRTPLTSIRAFSEMLYDDPRIELGERVRFLGIIVGETGRLTRLINQILDLAKLESGQGEWTTAVVDLGAVIRQAAESLSQVYRDKDVVLELVLPEYGPSVTADRDRLTQVMINLLSNAQKFVASGNGLVSVHLTTGADGARVEVTDNGSGVAADERETIFEKFRQSGSVLTDKPHGTGLGLPISRRIVEHFGGRLWAESRPGTGATFVFTLPIFGSPPETP